MSRPVVVLVGAPGSGKTTVGELVARALGCPFRDTDADVASAAGASIADIFLEAGEEHFRALEKSAVACALRDHRGVLALGGGAVLDPETRARLVASGAPIVHLDVSLADAVRRVGLARERPVLSFNPRAQLATLLAARAPLYAEVATAVVDTSGRRPDEIAADVLAVLGAAQSKGSAE